jgi:GntR family transcriptional regulator, rspAB operon transcriptional repressor
MLGTTPAAGGSGGTAAVLAGYLDACDEERLPQRAYQALRRAIREMSLAPGQMVLEGEAAQALGISRTPVREALVRLESEGLLRLVPRHGFAVAPLDPAGLREIYEILEGLETVAVDLAASRALPDQLARMDRSIADQERALDADDLIAWLAADDAFHDSLLEMSGNERLRRYAQSLGDQAYRARLFTHRLRPKPARSTEDHRAVATAIRAGDGETARALHQAHRRRARDEILGILQAVSPHG